MNPNTITLFSRLFQDSDIKKFIFDFSCKMKMNPIIFVKYLKYKFNITNIDDVFLFIKNISSNSSSSGEQIREKILVEREKNN